MKNTSDEIVSILQEEISNYNIKTERSETGTILNVGDGIATVYGLQNAAYGELVEFDTGVRGMVMNLERDSVGIVLLGREDGLREGSSVKRTGRATDVPVGEALLGRVVDSLGSPLDGKGPIKASETRPVEREASGVVTRQKVTVPLQTGIMARLQAHRKR